MIDLEIISHLGKYKIYISKIKYFYISDYNKRRSIINTIDGFFSKEKDSEFATEMNFTSKLFSDGQLVNINDFDYYIISDNFDIRNEMKLGSKSLFLKFLEVKTQKLEYTETYQTLQYILQNLEADLQTALFAKIKSIEFKLHIDFGKKQILKLLIPEMLKEGYLSNFLDVSYNDLITFQLELLLEIVKETNKKIIIILDISYFQDAWNHLLCSFPENTYFLLFNYQSFENMDFKDIFICNDKIVVDLFDDNTIYDLCMNENKNYTMEEYRAYLVSQLIL